MDATERFLAMLVAMVGEDEPAQVDEQDETEVVEAEEQDNE